MSDATFYAWEQKYAHLGVSELRRLRQLEEENSRLKRLVADLSLDQDRLAEAEVMSKRALNGKEKALGPDHPSTLGAVHNLGLFFKNQGRLVEAETMYQRHHTWAATEAGNTNY